MPSKGRRWEHARGIVHKRKMANADLVVKKAEFKKPEDEPEKEVEKEAKELIEKASEELEKDEKED